MDLNALSLPDWLPWWAVVGLLVPVAFYLALVLLMPFSTFGLRGRLREIELRIDALHEELRGLTLRLPDRGLDPYDDRASVPPIPPSPRDAMRAPMRDPSHDRDADHERDRPRPGLGDPVADRMLAYMREKAQAELQRADPQRPPAARARAEPRFNPPPRAAPPPAREAELPPPPPIAGLPGGGAEGDYPPDLPPPPPPPALPPRVPTRFGRRPTPPHP
ncbi:MAG: hypothetical protein IT555_18805 [Acetobacteraceae bacterium]|nr:hypothetical protein [Acetobacteraceae bacterium]